jgi:RNA polymerase subunit RPABC4/transcription elongation factor Spt4
MRGFVANAEHVDRGAVMSTCLSCGAYVRRGASYCPQHEPSRVSKNRGAGATQRKFRAAVLDAAGHRCECVTVVDGERVRCPVRGDENLECHHVRSLAAGGSNDPDNGRAVCRDHHLQLTRSA